MGLPGCPTWTFPPPSITSRVVACGLEGLLFVENQPKTPGCPPLSAKPEPPFETRRSTLRPTSDGSTATT